MRSRCRSTDGVNAAMPIVAIASLRPRPGVRFAGLALLSALSLVQARLSPGCLLARAFPSDGRLLSMTVWDSPAAMKRFARSGPHRLAMRLSGRLAVVDRFVHYQTASLPTVEEGRMRWRELRSA